jgi:competence protein ComEA
MQGGSPVAQGLPSVDTSRPPTTAPAAASPPAAAWPRPAQLAAAFLLGAACALLAVRLLGGPPGRPLDLQPAPPIDLNRAGAAEFQQLPGVGPRLANRIAEYRDARGGFRTADDLRSVPGIGPARLERVRPWIHADGGAAADDGGKEPPIAAKPPSALPKKAEALKEPVDLNRATAAELQKLPGVGLKLAQRILDERAKAPFAGVDELRRVSGIGPKTLEKLRPFVAVGGVQSK